MKIYISGPITGHTDYKQKFEKAAEELQKTFPNARIINPVYLADIFDDVHEAYMQVCRKIWEVTQPNTIYFLRGWEYSRGCQREKGWADADNCTCICQSLEVMEITPAEESAADMLKRIQSEKAEKAKEVEAPKPSPYGLKKCVVCGKEFAPRSSRTLACSDECRKIHNREKAAEYKEKMKEGTYKRRSTKTEAPKPSKAFEKEAELRKEGKRYADMQKAETLAMYGKVEK